MFQVELIVNEGKLGIKAQVKRKRDIMKNTIKHLSLSIMLCAAPAIKAMSLFKSLSPSQCHALKIAAIGSSSVIAGYQLGVYAYKKYQANQTIEQRIKKCKSDAQKRQLIFYIDQHPEEISLFMAACVDLVNSPETWWLVQEIEKRNANVIEPWVKKLFDLVLQAGTDDEADTTASNYVLYGIAKARLTIGDVDNDEARNLALQPEPTVVWARKLLYQALSPVYGAIAATLEELLQNIMSPHAEITTTQSHGAWELEQLKGLMQQDDKVGLMCLHTLIYHLRYAGTPYDQSIHAIIEQFKQHKEVITAVLKKAHESEAQATQDGAYTFYHAQNWTVHLVQDFYKALFNAMHNPNEAMTDDFIQLRFPTLANPSYSERKEDALFCNASLLGNLRIQGESTFEFFMRNQSMVSLVTMESLVEICKSFGIDHSAYEKELQELCELHKKANVNGLGNLLQIVIPKNLLNRLVKSAVPGPGECRTVSIGTEKTDDMERIADVLRHETNLLSPSLEETTVYTISMTQDALDQKTGHKIYQFNAADPEKLKEYTAARDALFAKIKRDFEANKTQVEDKK